MAMAPHYGRARVLHMIIEEAVNLLDDPIEEIVVGGGQVRIKAGRKEIAGTYGHSDRADADGNAMPGSGRWWVRF